jgi:hypothetical protein
MPTVPALAGWIHNLQTTSPAIVFPMPMGRTPARWSVMRYSEGRMGRRRSVTLA